MVLLPPDHKHYHYPSAPNRLKEEKDMERMWKKINTPTKSRHEQNMDELKGLAWLGGFLLLGLVAQALRG